MKLTEITTKEYMRLQKKMHDAGLSVLPENELANCAARNGKRYIREFESIEERRAHFEQTLEHNKSIGIYETKYTFPNEIMFINKEGKIERERIC